MKHFVFSNDLVMNITSIKAVRRWSHEMFDGPAPFWGKHKMKMCHQLIVDHTDGYTTLIEYTTAKMRDNEFKKFTKQLRGK